MSIRYNWWYTPKEPLPLVPQIDRVLTYAPVAPFRTYLAATGALYLGYKAAQALVALGRGITCYCLAGPLKLSGDLRRVGEWAVITGASDGMGKEYAHQLAAKGLNIVLIARNQEKLEKVAQEIRSVYKVLARVIVVDLDKITPEDARNLQEQLRSMRIALLINNAGVYPSNDRFLGSPPTDEQAVGLVTINIAAVVLITRAVLPLLLAQGKGHILNISSLLGEKPVMGSALYAASKTFVDYFSQALDYEYRERGVRVQCAMVGLVRTSLLPKDRHNSVFAVDARDACKSIIDLIGVRQRHHSHWKHAIMSHLGSSLSKINLLAH